MKTLSKIKYGPNGAFFLLRSFLVFTLSSMTVISPLLADTSGDGSEVKLTVPKKKSPLSLNLENTQIQPPGLISKSSSEYFSSIPDAKLLVPVHVWGEVKEPGVHFVPLGSSIAEAVSSSGGPTSTASMPTVTLRRKSESERDVDLFKIGLSEKVAAHDTIVISRSTRSDLPLYFGGISILLSAASLVVLLLKR